MTGFFGIKSPFLELCGIRPVTREPGRVIAEVLITPKVVNSSGLGHGGLTMTLLDTVLGSAARFGDPETTAVTVDLHVSFIGPARTRLVGEGRVVRRAGRMVFCEGEARDEAGEVVAKALGTFRVRHSTHPAHGRSSE
jgi:uncharacterized protein (TIGR00369 family)